MKIDAGAVWSTIEACLPSPAGIAADMTQVIEVCADTFPHPDWTRCTALPFAADARHLRDRLERAWGADPASFEVHSLWFGLCNPVLASGEATADLYLAAGRTYDATDPAFGWIEAMEHSPADRYAESGVLRAPCRESGNLTR